MKLKNLFLVTFLFAGAFKLEAMPLKPLSIMLIYSYINPLDARLLYRIPSEDLSDRQSFFGEEEGFEEDGVEEERILHEVYQPQHKNLLTKKVKKLSRDPEEDLRLEDLRQEDEEFLLRLFDNASYSSMGSYLSFSMGR